MFFRFDEVRKTPKCLRSKKEGYYIYIYIYIYIYTYTYTYIFWRERKVILCFGFYYKIFGFNLGRKKIYPHFNKGYDSIYILENITPYSMEKE